MEQKVVPDASMRQISDNTHDHCRCGDHQGEEREISSHAMVEQRVAD